MGVFHQYSMARLAQMPRLRELARNWLNFRLVLMVYSLRENDASVYSGHANPAPLASSSEGFFGLFSPP